MKFHVHHSDPFRALPARYIGFGYPIITAFGYTISPATHDLLSSLATGYIIFHCVHRGVHSGGGPKLVPVMFDTLLFDGFASVVIPSFITYHVRIVMRSLLTAINNPRAVIMWGPVITSLAALVFSWPHVDKFVDDALDQTVRQL